LTLPVRLNLYNSYDKYAIKASGFAFYLLKPIDPKELIIAVNKTDPQQEWFSQGTITNINEPYPKKQGGGFTKVAIPTAEGTNIPASEISFAS
jgi:hypothetical protein